VGVRRGGGGGGRSEGWWTDIGDEGGELRGGTVGDEGVDDLDRGEKRSR